MREISKKPSNINNRQQVTESFMLQSPIYDLSPPEPTSYPRTCHYTLQPDRHFAHKFSSFFLANTKPLLIGCDIGIPVQQLILFSQQYNNQEGVLHTEDQMLIREILPSDFQKNVKRKKDRQTSQLS